MIIIDYTGNINFQRIWLIVRWVACTLMLSVNFLFFFHDLFVLEYLNLVNLIFIYFWVYLLLDLTE